MVAFRRGQLTEAEKYFRASLQLNPKDAGALSGLANAYAIVSRFKTAWEIRLQAYAAMPTDPVLMANHAETLRGEARIQALEQVLAIYDPSTPEARSLRFRIAILRALGDKTPGRLASAYAPAQLKSMTIQNGVKQKRGVGLRVQGNRHAGAGYGSIRHRCFAGGYRQDGIAGARQRKHRRARHRGYRSVAARVPRFKSSDRVR